MPERNKTGSRVQAMGRYLGAITREVAHMYAIARSVIGAYFCAGAETAIKGFFTNLNESLHRVRGIHFPRTRELARMIVTLADQETRRMAGRAAASLGAVAVVTGALPLIEHRADVQSADNAWRLKARAFAEAEQADAEGRADPGLAAAERRFVLARGTDRAAVAPFQTFAQVHFDNAARQRDDLECLSRAIFYEARNESVSGQLAVAEVVLNRVRHRLYPNNVCDVIYEGTDRETGLSYRGTNQSCQFSFTCDGSEERFARRGEGWRRAQAIAANALMGLSAPITNEATHYHANYVSPYWAPRLEQTKTIGAHIFYRFPSADGDRGA